MSASRTYLMAIAWGLMAFIVFVTLGPQSLRPHLASAALERFGAYFLTAAVFVAAYPRRPRLIGVIAVAVAVLLELGQFIAPGRDPGLKDAVEKAVGGVCGVIAVTAVLRLRRDEASA